MRQRGLHEASRSTLSEAAKPLRSFEEELAEAQRDGSRDAPPDAADGVQGTGDALVMVCMALQTTQEHLKGLGRIVQEQERRIRDLETAR
jgi:hypothetical protein